MDEKSVCANIEKLVGLLNAELRAAHELGLKIRIGGDGVFFQGPPQMSLNVWRETPLVNVPRFTLDAVGPELSLGRGKVSTENKK